MMSFHSYKFFMDLLFFMTVTFTWCVTYTEIISPIGILKEVSTKPNSELKGRSSSDCSDQSISDTHGVITSPNYPESYPNHISCTWHISGKPGDVVTMSFYDLDIEESGECNKSMCCEDNWVKIGSYANGTEAQYCGMSGLSYNVFVSTTSRVWIKFHISKFVNGGRGFWLYYIVGPKKNAICDEHHFKCNTGDCVPISAKCNKQVDCLDGSDETECEDICSPRRSCSSVPYCYDSNKHCDGVIDCQDFSDEIGCGRCSPNHTRCGSNSTQCFNPITQRCNKILDCINGEDEKNCKQLCPGKIMCSSGSVCYKLSERCDGIAQCGDSSDEKDCGPELCNYERGGFLCANGHCIREVWKCDRTNDCGDGSDEANCLRNSVLTAAIMGSLVCILLLIVAVSCICRLYALRSVENSSNHETPLSRLSQEFFFREPPPSYAVAVGEHHRSLCIENMHYSTNSRRNRRRPRRTRRRHELPHSPVSTLDNLLSQTCIVIGPGCAVPVPPSSIPTPDSLLVARLPQSSQSDLNFANEISTINCSSSESGATDDSSLGSVINKSRTVTVEFGIPSQVDLSEISKSTTSTLTTRNSSDGFSSFEHDEYGIVITPVRSENSFTSCDDRSLEVSCDTDDMQPLITS